MTPETWLCYQQHPKGQDFTDMRGSVTLYAIIHVGKTHPTVSSIYGYLTLYCVDTQCGFLEPNGKTFPLGESFSLCECAAVSGLTHPFNNNLAS